MGELGQWGAGAGSCAPLSPGAPQGASTSWGVPPRLYWLGWAVLGEGARHAAGLLQPREMGERVVVGGSLGFGPSLWSELPSVPCHWGRAPARGWPQRQSSWASHGISGGCQFTLSSPQVLVATSAISSSSSSLGGAPALSVPDGCWQLPPCLAGVQGPRQGQGGCFCVVPPQQKGKRMEAASSPLWPAWLSQ